MKLEDLEAKLGIDPNMGEEDKLALVKEIQANIPALRAEQRVLEAKTQANLVVEAIKKIKEGLEARFDELNGIVDVKVRDITSGKDGIDGKDGKDGVNGKDGRDGISITGPKGADGADGNDGVGVQDAHIDFDGSLIITLTTGKELNVGEVVPMDVAEKIKIISNGGGTSQSVLDSIASLQSQINTLIPSQTGNSGKYLTTDGATTSWATVTAGSGTVTSVATSGTVNGITLTGGPITSTGTVTLGGTLDLSSPPAIGSTAASTGAFTTLSASSTVSGTGFSTYLASPPAIGGTTASTGRFTTVTSTVATGTAPFTVASTTAVANLSIGGNAGTVTNGVYTTDTGTVTNTMLAGSIANAKLTNSSITFGSTAQALGSTVSAISGVTIDNGAIGGTAAAAGTFTTLIGGSGSANYEQITGGATGKAVQFQSLGSDAAVSLAIQSKGTTGAIDLSAQGGVNISNGGTVTAVTRSVTSSGYTSIPSVAISAPTTAGGVQATATMYMAIVAGTVQSGGSGYTLNDVLTVVGGTPTGVAGTITVTGVTGGVITSISSTNFAQYSALPTNPVSVTGGTGSGATFNLTYLNGSFNITNAGSGYVEQPTVTFSGGGAAYATVGGIPKIQTLGSALSFYTPSGEAFRIVDIGATSTTYWGAIGSGTTPYLNAYSGANDAFIQTNGASSLRFRTNYGGTAAEQMRVFHTATAVNYVQVTGGVTGNPATVTASAQGSDANVNMRLTPKGTGTLLTATAATILDGTAIPAGGTAGAGYKLSSTANFGIFFGSGAPTLSAAKGSLYMRSDGSSIATRMYINTDGSTTWTNVVTAA